MNIKSKIFKFKKFKIFLKIKRLIKNDFKKEN